MKTYTKMDQPEILKYIFHPRPDMVPESPAGSEDFKVQIDNSIMLSCRLFTHEQEAPTILFFHGNGEIISDYDTIGPIYNKIGLNFIIGTYRGYGRSSGQPTVNAMIADCKPTFERVRLLCEERNLTGPLFIMGRSIGSVAAIELAYSMPDTFKGLIIESGFADTLPLLSNLGLDPALHSLEEKDGFGNRDKISTIKKPTLILHGSNDAIIPIHQAERLQSFSGARTKKFFIIPGADHNSVMSSGGEHYFSTIKGFIDEVTGNNNWRRRRKKFRNKE